MKNNYFGPPPFRCCPGSDPLIENLYKGCEEQSMRINIMKAKIINVRDLKTYKYQYTFEISSWK